MTITALITLNAVLGGAVFCALVLLLGHGIRSDRRIRVVSADVVGARGAASERLAA